MSLTSTPRSRARLDACSVVLKLALRVSCGLSADVGSEDTAARGGAALMVSGPSRSE